MSYLNLVMMPDFISVISDGQITTADNMTQSHFKKFETSPAGFVVGITGFEQITNRIRKKFFYQPNLTFNQAKELLQNELDHLKTKQINFGQDLCFNALLAGFPQSLTGPSEPEAISFHIAQQSIQTKTYHKAAVLSLLPDDIDFNPNKIITENLPKHSHASLSLQVQILQRNALYKVAETSATVNKVVFQELIRPSAH